MRVYADRLRLANTTIRLEKCNSTFHADTLGLPLHATATCASGQVRDIRGGATYRAVCGSEATCTDTPLIYDVIPGDLTDVGNASSARVAPSCTCDAEPYSRYPMPSSLASETIRAIVPYVDGCVTPRQPTEITEIAKELTVMLVKTRFAVVPQVRLLNLNLVCSDLSPQQLTTFEIIGTVPTWLDFYQISVAQNNSIPHPSVVGNRLDQTNKWILVLNATVSAAGLARAAEPYATTLNSWSTRRRAVSSRSPQRLA